MDALANAGTVRTLHVARNVLAYELPSAIDHYLQALAFTTKFDMNTINELQVRNISLMQICSYYKYFQKRMHECDSFRNNK